MIKETWYSGQNREKNPMEFDSNGGTYIDDNDKPHFMRFKHLNNKERFEKALEGKKVAQWAYRHNLGLYGNEANRKDDNGYDIEARGHFLGQESFYDEDNFFYIKLDKYEKPMICQLRVANHELSFIQYQRTHSIPKEIQCDTCLNIQIGNLKRDKFDTAAANSSRITVINAILDEENETEEQLQEIDEFVRDVTYGRQPTVTLNDIKRMFNGNVEVKESGADKVRDNQFIERLNLKRKRPIIVNWYEKQDGFPDKIPFNAVSVKPEDKIEFKGKTYHLTYYDGKTYAYDEDDMVAYPIKTRGGLSLSNPIVVENKKYNKTLYITENQKRRLFKECKPKRIIISEAQRNRLFFLDEGWEQMSFDFDDANNETNIEITEDWVQKHYDKYNQELFDGKLDNFSDIKFVLSHNKNTWGMGGVTRHLWNSDGSLGYGKTYLELNNLYSYREEDAINTLVHEMVHIYEHTREPKYIAEVKRIQRFTQDYPKDGHGTIFYREANRLKGLGFKIERYVNTEEVANARLNGEMVADFKKKHPKGMPIIVKVGQDKTAYIAKVLTKQTLNKWKEYFKTRLSDWKKTGNQPQFVSLYYAQNIGKAEKEIRKTNVGEYSYPYYEPTKYQSALDYIIGQFDMQFGEPILTREDCTLNDNDLQLKQQYESEKIARQEEMNNQKMNLANKALSNANELAEEIINKARITIYKNNKVPIQLIDTCIGKVYVDLPSTSKDPMGRIAKVMPHFSGDTLYLWSNDKVLSKSVYNAIYNRNKGDEQIHQQGIQAIITLINQAIEYEKNRK